MTLTVKKNILLLGDVFFSKKDMKSFFYRIANEFKDYIVIANLEGSIKFNSVSLTDKSVHLSLPKINKNEIPENLIFSCVNNHVTDFGINNFYKNIKHFDKKAVISSTDKIVNFIGNKKFIFLADKKEQCLLKGTNFLGFNNRQISKISNKIKSSIVVIHGGIEYRHYPTPYQRNLARKIIEYGADMVVFHHSHIIGHHEYWHGKLIHYGLGNAFFSDTLDLHLLNQSISNGVICDKDNQVISLKNLKKVCLEGNSEVLNINNLNHSQYIRFYKKRYKIDSSFRPRQLGSKDIWIEIQYFIWSFIAEFLVRNNQSKKIKNFISRFLEKAN